jgi:hypothetical protein
VAGWKVYVKHRLAGGVVTLHACAGEGGVEVRQGKEGNKRYTHTRKTGRKD